MYVLPSLDVQGGRSRLVWWPGAAAGRGTPTDRPEAIAEAFVAQGAPAIHLVDLDGAVQGRPANIAAIGAVARAVAKPLQVAGGIDGPEQVETGLAAGATRVVMPAWAVVEDGAVLARSLRIAGEWLAVGLDARPESLRAYPWRQRPEPGLEELVVELHGAGVQRFVFSHAGAASIPLIGRLAGALDAELLVAGGLSTLDELRRLHDAGAAGAVLGEALFTGAIDLAAAIRAVA